MSSMEEEIIMHLQKAVDCLCCTYTDNVGGPNGLRDTEKRREFIHDMMVRILGIQSEIRDSNMFPVGLSCPYCGYAGADIVVYTYTKYRRRNKDAVERSAYGCPNCRMLF